MVLGPWLDTGSLQAAAGLSSRAPIGACSMRGPFNAVATGAYAGATGQGRPGSRPKAATAIARAGERVKGANGHPRFTSARRLAFATIPRAVYSVHLSGLGRHPAGPTASPAP